MREGAGEEGIGVKFIDRHGRRRHVALLTPFVLKAIIDVDLHGRLSRDEPKLLRCGWIASTRSKLPAKVVVLANHESHNIHYGIYSYFSR